MQLTTNSPKETQKLAADLAQKLLAKKPRRALILALSGELGSGKTTFIKGFSKALRVKEKILSPTFVLIHRHKIKKLGFKNLYHIDAYRLKSGRDLLKLGIKEIFTNPENIVSIEWADRVKKAVPKNAVWIRFEHMGKDKRSISIEQKSP